MEQARGDGNKKVRLELELPGGASLAMRVDPEVTLSRIRDLVHERTGLAPNKQSLYHRDRALAGNHPLSHYGLSCDDEDHEGEEEEEEEETIMIRVERGLLGGAWCCICFIPCPPPCCKKKDDDSDDDTPKDNYYPSK